MKKNSLIILLLISIILISGCDNNIKKKVCSKNVTTSDNKTEITEEYEIYYDKHTKLVTKTISNGTITSTDTSILQLHMDSNEKSCKIYDKIPYYDCDVTLSGSSLFVKRIINYKKVDYKKIIAIEGKNGNIFENDGTVKLDTLINIYTNNGSECE